MEYIGFTVATVLKVLLAGVTGSIAEAFLPGGEQSVKDINFVSSNVFTPCFTFGNLIYKFTLTLVVKSALVLFTTLVTFATGYASALITAKFCVSKTVWLDDLQDTAEPTEAATTATAASSPKDGRTVVFTGWHAPPPPTSGEAVAVTSAWQTCCRWAALGWSGTKGVMHDAVHTPSPREYYGLYVVCLTLQNTATFPIAMLQAMVNEVPWFDNDTYAEALSVVFAYQCIWNIYYWSFGMRVLQRSARSLRKHREAKARRQLLQQQQQQDAEAARRTSNLEDQRHTEERRSLRLALPVRTHITEPVPSNKSDPTATSGSSHGGGVGGGTGTGGPADGDQAEMERSMPRHLPSGGSSGGGGHNDDDPSSHAGQGSANASFAIQSTMGMLGPAGAACAATLAATGEASNDVTTVYSGSESDDGEDLEPIVYPDVDLIAGPYHSWFRLSHFSTKLRSSVYINLPLLSSVVGIVVGILCSEVGFFKWLFFRSPVSILIGAMNLVGDGAIPLSLVVLGANLTMSGMEPLRRVDRRFIVVCTIVRLFVTPLINVGYYFFCDAIGIMPAERSLRLAMWIEMVGPTAIVVSVLCCLQNVLPAEASALLLVQNILAVVSTTLWLTIFLVVEQ